MSLVRVAVGACRCPNAPHGDGDWVDLRPAPTIDIGAAVYAAVQQWSDDPIQLQVSWTRAYLRYGVAAWSFVDADGPVLIRPMSDGYEDLVNRLLPFDQGGFEVADRCDDLYAEVVLRPLLTRLSLMRSQGGQTDGSTSPTPDTSPSLPTPSEPSSPDDMGGKPSEDQDR